MGVLLVLVNVVCSFGFFRLDLTSEKRFSLSPATKDLLRSLKDVVYFKVYLEGEFPAGFKRLRNATHEMLDEFKIYAGDNLHYEFINPSEHENQKERNRFYNQLADKGLQPTNLQVNEGNEVSEQVIFPGAIASYITKEFPVQLLKDRLGESADRMLNQSIQSLEYEFANCIRQLTLTKKPVLGILSGHGGIDSLQIEDFRKSLGHYYQIKDMAASGGISGDSLYNPLLGLDILMVAKPMIPFGENEKFLIDQFIMAGGRTFWLIDGLQASMDSLKTHPFFLAPDLPLNLDDQMFNYGARINASLVLDLKCGAIPLVTGVIGNRPKTELRPWFYFPLVFPENVHPLVQNLNAIQFRFASSVDTVGAPGIKKTILLRTSDFSKVLFSPARVNLGLASEKPDPVLYPKRGVPLAVLLEGQFKSLFKNRVPLALEQFKIQFREKSEENKMIVAGDGDLVLNDVKRSTGQVYPLGYDSYTGQQYGNGTFILNAIDYLCDDSGLMELRAKEFKLRILDKNKLEKEKNFWIALNAGLPVLMIVSFGIFKFWRRKKTYSGQG